MNSNRLLCLAPVIWGIWFNDEVDCLYTKIIFRVPQDWDGVALSYLDVAGGGVHGNFWNLVRERDNGVAFSFLETFTLFGNQGE